jgi:hypothetical protein
MHVFIFAYFANYLSAWICANDILAYFAVKFFFTTKIKEGTVKDDS